MVGWGTSFFPHIDTLDRFGLIFATPSPNMATFVDNVGGTVFSACLKKEFCWK